jgi:hypothetical protein
MNQGSYIFSQLLGYVPKDVFDRIVKKYDGNKYVKSFTCWNQFCVMVYAQLAERESLRDLESVLMHHQSCLHHMGMGRTVSKSTLAYANMNRDPEIFREMALKLVKIARDLRVGRCTELDEFIDGDVYAFDSTTLSLCLSRFPWLKLHHEKAGVKVHTLFDIKTDIPAFFIYTEASLHDSKVMEEIPYVAGSYYVFDRAYMVTPILYSIHNTYHAYFVVREKSHIRFNVIEDRAVDSDSGVMTDQIIRLDGLKTKYQYPENLRRVTYHDAESGNDFVFYTNNRDVSAEQVALLYRYRWRVELFFKWMKQHLHIKEFFGHNENAIQIQIYTAISAYCIVAIAEHKLNLGRDMYEVLRVLQGSLYEKIPLRDFFEAGRKWQFATDEPNFERLQLMLNF